jgi:hypothetical protein
MILGMSRGGLTETFHRRTGHAAAHGVIVAFVRGHRVRRRRTYV